MVLERLGEVDEDKEEVVDHKIPEDHENDDEGTINDNSAPSHPVAALQDAFQESIDEATEGLDDEEDVTTPPNAESRRQRLLDNDSFDESWTTRWKQNPSARCHPLMKLMAQIIFGLHLLHQQLAKSDSEVVKILQTHVDEIDGFLEKTTEDFDLAIKDIEERMGFLKLPMTHIEVFDAMLEDKKFRTQLIEGNDKIETIIELTAKAMNAALLDIQKGVNAREELGKYLDRVGNDWPQDTADQQAIFAAMRGNEEGWRACLRELQVKGNKLGVSLVQLGTVIGEMSKLAAAASRRHRMKQDSKARQAENRVPQSKYAGSTAKEPSNSRQHSRKPSREIANKPLPKDPDAIGAAVKATIPRAHSVSIDDHRYERPREKPPTPQIRSPRATQPSSPRPIQQPIRTQSHTSGMRPREPCSPVTSQTKALAGFIKHTAPPTDQSVKKTEPSTSHRSSVRSNPAQQTRPTSAKRPTMDLHRHPSEHAPQPVQHPTLKRQDSSHAPQVVSLSPPARHPSEFAPQPLHTLKPSTASSDSAKGFSNYEKPPERQPPPSPRSTNRLALFPGTAPPTPRQVSRASSVNVLSSNGSMTPGVIPNQYVQPKSSGISLRRLFHRKNKRQAIAT